MNILKITMVRPIRQAQGSPAHHIADEHRLTQMASQCHPEALEGQPKSTNRSLSEVEMTTYSNILLLLTKVNVHFIVSILLIILFLGSCSDPFPKGALFDLMILQKLVSGESLATTTTTSNKYIFLTVGTYTGALIGGITGADSKCQTEKTSNFASVPGAATEYKAFLVNDTGTKRQACSTPDCSGGILENIDWVLKPNTDYYRLDGATDTKIFTTNASGIVDFTGGATLLTAIDSSGTTKWWTGIATDWTYYSACNDHNWNTIVGNGSNGVGGSTGDTSIQETFLTSCNGPLLKLLCVRQ